MLGHQKEHGHLGFGNEGELARDLVFLEEQRKKMSKETKMQKRWFLWHDVAGKNSYLYICFQKET